ncbi:MAG: 4Fe-4S binding protein [Candidatus Helarchaeota archaeon]
MMKKACIIGSGLSALNAAVELADSGIEVTVISRDRYAGENAPNLYKAFPTDDCFFCVSATRLKDGIRKCFYRSGIFEHPNIKMYFDSKVESIEGNGPFLIKMQEGPIYIDHEKCIQCGACEEACPKTIQLKRKLQMTRRKAIYHRLQCLPYSYYIDREACPPDCEECIKACPVEGVINLNAPPKHLELEASVIILALSYKEFDPTNLTQLHYNTYKNVITQVQLARMLDPTGPTEGKIVRRSDNRPAKRIFMLQCVGSRDVENLPYCSEICCTFACKHALIIKNEREPETQVSIIYKDIRTLGLQEKYYREARDSGIDFVKGHLSLVKELSDGTLELLIYDALLNKLVRCPADLLILSAGLMPSENALDLLSIANISLDDFKFTVKDLDLVETNRKGIYAIGSIVKPLSIPEASILAKAATFKILENFT